MPEIFLVVAVTATAFVSTSLDNLILLVALSSSPVSRHRDVSIGYALAVASVLGLAAAGSYAFDLVGDDWLRYLGLVPIGIGLWRLRDLVGGRVPGVDREPPWTARAGVAASFGVMIANSGDSLGVFASLMGETEDALVPAIFLTALAMAVAWCLLARWLVVHPLLAPRLRLLDRYAVPPLLFAVGLYILMNTPTDTV